MGIRELVLLNLTVIAWAWIYISNRAGFRF